jgi:cellular nucleic acid-binding protein
LSRECPSGGGGRAGGFGAQAGGFGGGGARKCYVSALHPLSVRMLTNFQNCGQDGHISKECPQEQGRTVSLSSYAVFPTKTMQCYQCGQVGHISANCPGGGEAPAS